MLDVCIRQGLVFPGANVFAWTSGKRYETGSEPCMECLVHASRLSLSLCSPKLVLSCWTVAPPFTLEVHEVCSCMLRGLRRQALLLALA